MKRSKFQREALALLREQNATLRRIAAVVEQNSKAVEIQPVFPPLGYGLPSGRSRQVPPPRTQSEGLL